MDNTFNMDLLGGNQWKSFLEVKAHLVAKNADGTRARAVCFLCAVVKNMLQEI